MESYLKRKADAVDESTKQNCPHGEKCYRRNIHHFKEYQHPHLLDYLKKGEDIPHNLPQPKNVYLEQLKVLKDILKIKPPDSNQPQTSAERSTKKFKDTNSSNVARSSKFPEKKEKTTIYQSLKGATSSTSFSSDDSMLKRWDRNAPYYIFFTTIPKSPPTLKHKNSITFTDILCPSLGKLKCTLQINFMIDVMWLMEQYKARNVSSLPMTILYGYEFPQMEEFMDKYLKQVTYHQMKMKDPFGIHHSKVGIYVYDDDSLRVVISTANLYYEDWNHYNQGLWLSPRCPPMTENSVNNGESPTRFKSDLLCYLKTYGVPCLKPWIERVEKTDFSQIRVFLVTSTPGKHYPDDKGSHVHTVARLLKKHCNLPAKTTPESEGPSSWGVIAQSSSIGSLGKTAGDWLRSTFLRSLAAHKAASLTTNPNATLSFVFPTVDNVMTGHFGPESGGCLPYAKNVNEKQRWFQDYLHQWKADRLQRSRAMPHIKSYTRVSPCLTKLAYYLLTSANLSKSAWGGNIQKDQGVYIRSYEVGVLFLPELFEEEYFEISQTLSSKNSNVFPFMYDLPLTPYKSDDYPWCN
ncbi:probable tyrosyl-DNA phosphodiesterase [Coccinella septempunctata]|uniref:probable tyrosyl-DNA phosphodiesterase n=1 Tax=Coccinella septempunctata TaxID=41139 RepID=UPI001D096D6A|nr:probable tyrosyl-DNA phosphodiesterase [Coccinella septempunctata]